MSFSDRFPTRNEPFTDPAQHVRWLLVRTLQWGLALLSVASALLLGPMGAVLTVRAARSGGLDGLVAAAVVAVATVAALGATLRLGVGQLVAAICDKTEGEP